MITERAFLRSAHFLARSLRAGRGSYLIGEVQDFLGESSEGGAVIRAGADLPDHSVDSKILQYWIGDDGTDQVGFEPVRPIPDEHAWFEQVWKEYLEERRF